MSRPRVSRTVAPMPCSSSAARNAAIASRALTLEIDSLRKEIKRVEKELADHETDMTALRSRSYNPGLVTAVLLFIPLGAAILVSIWTAASVLQIATGLVLAVAIHAAIMIHMKRRIASLHVTHLEEGGQHGRI